MCTCTHATKKIKYRSVPTLKTCEILIDRIKENAVASINKKINKLWVGKNTCNSYLIKHVKNSIFCCKNYDQNAKKIVRMNWIREAGKCFNGLNFRRKKAY